MRAVPADGRGRGRGARSVPVRAVRSEPDAPRAHTIRSSQASRQAWGSLGSLSPEESATSMVPSPTTNCIRPSTLANRTSASPIGGDRWDSQDSGLPARRALPGGEVADHGLLGERRNQLAGLGEDLASAKGPAPPGEGALVDQEHPLVGGDVLVEADGVPDDTG